MELLVGADGLFGRAYRRLHPEANSIICVDRTNSHLLFGDSRPGRVNLASIKSFLGKLKPERVIYAAQHSDYRNFSNHNLRSLHFVNVEQPVSLAEVLSGLGINGTFFSSGSVYAPQKAQLSETDPLKTPQNSDPYVSSRIAMEYSFQTRQFVSEILLLRPFPMFGAGQRETMLFPRLIENVRSNRPIFLDGKVGLLINPIPINLAVTAVLELQNQNQRGVFNLASNVTLSLYEIASLIGEVMKKKVHLSYQNPELDPQLVGSTKRLQDATGLELQFDFEKELNQIIHR